MNKNEQGRSSHRRCGTDPESLLYAAGELQHGLDLEVQRQRIKDAPEVEEARGKL